ncbi:MAG: hypothetical protein Q9M19_03260 [Mariprofundaceae bacterium]|nr:hypothetical protein [Mariprofundaceae bacterium]
MEFRKLMAAAALMAVVSFGASTASASTAYMNDGEIFDQKYPGAHLTNSCLFCHTGTPGAMTSYGDQFKAAGGSGGGNGTLAQLTAIDGKDADGDNIANGTEITNATGTNNLDVITNVTTGQVTTTADSDSSGGGGCMTASAATPLMMFLGLLSLGFFVRRKKD